MKKYETDKSAANEQIRVFLDFIKRTEECFSVQIPMKHCFNSAGIMDLKNDALNIARIGIASIIPNTPNNLSNTNNPHITTNGETIGEYIFSRTTGEIYLENIEWILINIEE